MKRVLYIVAILALISAVSFAQLGIKGGLNLGTFGGADNKEPMTGMSPTARTGFTAGAYYNIGLVLGLSLQPGVSYTQKGAVYQVDGAAFGAPGVSIKETIQLDYLDIPVVVKWAPLPLPVVKPFVEGGVSYSILMSGKAKTEAAGQTNSTDIKSQFPSNDFSIVLGAGVDLNLLVLNLTVDARYVMGEKTLDKAGNAKVYNRGFQATVGINF